MFPEMEQENEKKFLVFKTIAFVPGSPNSHIVEQDTCRWQSICYQATRRLRYHKGRYIPQQFLEE